jgi:surface carbohydrate biosynthesis protein
MSTVALPIETKVREFHGKLWLALNLLERDHNVILGPSWEVDTTIHKTKPDAYISKDVSDGNVSYCEDLREAGIRVYGLPTEGGIGASGESWSSTRSQIVDHLDGFLCWGTAHKNVLSTHYDATDSLYVTGNPRFDLQYDRVRSIYGPKAMSLGEEYGPFILFNTNFGRANPFDRKLRHNTLERVFGEVDEETIRHDSRVFHAFVEGILYLSSELEDLDIIVRPHPGEHHGTYRQSFSQYEDI